MHQRDIYLLGPVGGGAGRVTWPEEKKFPQCVGGEEKPVMTCKGGTRAEQRTQKKKKYPACGKVGQKSGQSPFGEKIVKGFSISTGNIQESVLARSADRQAPGRHDAT